MKRQRENLTIWDVLAWADAHHERTGRWPSCNSGVVHDRPGARWSSINTALMQGFRGFRGGSSVAKLLAKHRGVRPGRGPSTLTLNKIITWADEHRRRTGEWPTHKSGPIEGTEELNWRKVDNALRLGLLGMSGASSLSRLLAERRGKRNKRNVPPLTIPQIVAWADSHHKRMCRWPQAESGPVPRSNGETWGGINGALIQGTRGMAGGDSVEETSYKVRHFRQRRRSSR